MSKKRLFWGAFIVVVLVGLWRTYRHEPAFPEKAEPVGSISLSNHSAIAAIGRPPAIKALITVSDRVATSNVISASAMLLGQATQSLDLSYEVFSKFTPGDVDYLNHCYRSRTNLLDRRELTRVLGVVGNEETVRLFVRCLLNEQAGKSFKEEDTQIGRDPEVVLWTTVTSLGVLASRHDSAFEFLKRAIRPEYWSAAINWQSQFGDSNVGLMTDWAIQALGNTGRAEAREILAGLLRNPPTPWPPAGQNKRQRTFEGAIISAAYMLDRIEEVGGMANFNAGHGPPLMVGFQQWSASEKGKLWLQKKQ